ncbi:anthranilate synthase component I family protein [Halobaculum sp. P14]|uniref:anthranilate synthase component I family protein n=1 Tax=Halobaculum sp. P14 TaxID=3421638 RepID=UPI003EC074C6
MQTVTDRETYRRLAADAPADARIPVEGRVAVDDPFAAYRRARRDAADDAPETDGAEDDGAGDEETDAADDDAGSDRPGGVFYETTGGQSGFGLFGVDPAERLTVGADAVTRDPEHPGHGDYAEPSPTLEALEGVVDAETLVRGDCDVPYPCGLFGWLSYDVARELESLPGDAVDDRGLPRLQFGLYDTVASWTEPRDGDGPVTLRITSCPRLSDHADADAAYDAALDAAESLAERIRRGDPAVGPARVDADAAAFESDCGRDAYADRVRAVKRYVRDGDTFQANVSQRLTAPAAVHPVAAYAALRRVNPAPYSGLVEFPGVDLVSASPELLLRRDPNPDRGDDVADAGDDAPDRHRADAADRHRDADAAARLETEPIAGTRPRGDDAAADAAMEAELTGDEKERAEHAMLVDLERNDLGKVSRYGSVDVAEYRRVDRYAEVMHLVSRVEGDERRDRSLADALAATFPGGTITGAPKPRTMEIIDELEATRRGPYTGSMAAVGFDGRAVFNIVIRTLVRTGDRYHLRVGAGVVHDSDPDAEYEETLAKARALVTAVDEALDDESMEVRR